MAVVVLDTYIFPKHAVGNGLIYTVSRDGLFAESAQKDSDL